MSDRPEIPLKVSAAGDFWVQTPRPLSPQARLATGEPSRSCRSVNSVVGGECTGGILGSVQDRPDDVFAAHFGDDLLDDRIGRRPGADDENDRPRETNQQP